MGEKVDEFYSRRVLEYNVVRTIHARTKKPLKVPRIADQETVTLDDLIARATSCGYLLARPSHVKAQVETLMSLITDYLAEGKAVNLGGYFRVQPYLTGNVNETGRLTPKNKLAVRITALAKLKMRLTSFAWRLKGDRVKKL